MHQSSLEKMTRFRDQYLAEKKGQALTILDLGSQDICGSYRSLFEKPGWSYRGLDMASGKNVDVVLKTPYVWHPIKSHSADVVISGQAFEHIEYFWITMLEIARVLKPNGLCCILAPSSGPEHRYPVDCWRFYPDGMRVLADFSKLKILEVTTQWDQKEYPDGSHWWHDSMLVCQKQNRGVWGNFLENFKRGLKHRAMTFSMR